MSRKWTKREKEIMRKLGLQPTKGSGSGWIEKEDGQSDEIIAQLKSTEGKGIRVDHIAVRDLFYNARVTHKIPVFVLDFMKYDHLLVCVRPKDLVKVAKLLGDD